MSMAMASIHRLPNSEIKAWTHMLTPAIWRTHRLLSGWSRRSSRPASRIDILVNNAGVTFSYPLLEYPDDAWDKTYQVNLRAVFLLSRAAGKEMVKRGKGSIINITSLNAEMAFPANPAYMACKGGLRQLTKSLAIDLGPHGIRANNVGPGYFVTEMTTSGVGMILKNGGSGPSTPFSGAGANLGTWPGS